MYNDANEILMTKCKCMNIEELGDCKAIEMQVNLVLMNEFNNVLLIA